MKGWGSKAWDGCLQVRAINVLHSICVSDYYHYYYQYYYYFFITIIIIVVVVIFQLRKAAIIKRALIGLSYVARAGQII